MPFEPCVGALMPDYHLFHTNHQYLKTLHVLDPYYLFILTAVFLKVGVSRYQN